MKKKLILLCISFLIVCGIFVGCKKEEAPYTISYLSEEGTEECAQVLSKMMEEVCGMEVSIEADKLHTEEYLIYLGRANLAAQTGTDLSALSEKGYLIEKVETKIYIYALSKEGQYMALAEFIKYVSENGTIEELDERIVCMGTNLPSQVLVGEAEIGQYTIVLPEKSSEIKENAAKKLQYYICATAGAYIPIVEYKDYEAGSLAIMFEDCDQIELANTSLSYELNIVGGQIKIRCVGEKAYEQSVTAFANTYLGWAFAGTDNEHISTVSEILRIPYDTTFMEEDVVTWMEEREAIICLWKTNTSRGAYYNGNTSLASEIMTYSDDEIHEYIKMLKYCGFTGIQVTDMCSNWSAFGGYEFAHDRLRTMADAAHSLDMKFTLWVWGAEFTGYGWVDETVTYSSEGYNFAYENPDVVATFDKYYSIYAELADCCDRVIGHYSDPGQLVKQEDIGYFAAMLRDKFRSVNPDISFGVNCWRDDIDRSVLRAYLGTDFMALEGGYFANSENRTKFRSSCNYLGIPVGTWSWNGCEMEIDQLAQMNVNAKSLQNRYLEVIATGDVHGKSTYWSEMDSYHVLNVFSLYCAGHLLQNPYADTEQLLRDVAYDTVGKKYGEDMYEILDLIQDARTGESDATFLSSSKDYILTSDAYDADDILERSTRLLPILQEMIDANLQTNVIPLPLSVTELLQLIEPHVAQIQQFAQFRKGMYELEEMYNNGASASEMQAKVEEIYVPIPEYNCIIGMFGQVEARAQYKMVEEFCAKTGLSVPDDPVFNYYRKQRIYQEMCSYQKGREDIYYRKKGFYQWGMAFSEEAAILLENELIEEGLLSETEDGYIYVTDWENYRYHFN